MALRVENCHVFITGGSSGIGLALAEEFIRNGTASVSIAARSVERLTSAQKQLEEVASSSAAAKPQWTRCSVHKYPADVSDFQSVGAAVREAESTSGPIDFLVSCAGSSTPGHCINMDISVYEQQMKVNYLGAVGAVKSVLPGMVERRRGCIVLVSSILGLFGISGYSAYSPSKFALRGFADCLRNELQGTGVSVMIGYPPDTDTPGFHMENLTKPPETVEISQDGSLFKPEVVARCLMRGIKRGGYHLPTPDLGQSFIVWAQAGFTPRPFSLLVEAVLAPLVVVILRVFGWGWDRIVRKHRKRSPYGVAVAAGDVKKHK